MERLMSMVDYVIYTYDQTEDSLDSEQKMFEYANFLKQPLSIEMFVPCDENGNVLEEKSIFNTTDEDYIFNSEAFDNYQQAKERCLFEGFEVKFKDCKVFKYQSEKILLYMNDTTCVEYNCYHKSFVLFIDNEIIFENISTIEDLVKYNPKLTATALKQIL